MQSFFDRFGIMLDCSRNGVMTVSALKKWIDIISSVGYNALLLYTEDTYEIENNPYFGHLRGRYSFEELAEIEEYTNEKGIEFIPCIQTLAHLNAIFHWNEYQDIKDCDDILLAKSEKTYELIDDMFRSLAKTLKTRTVNIGMDEAYMLGRGRYFDNNNECDRMQILIDHLKKVCEIAGRYGFRLIMWGDMFIRIVNNGDRYGKKNVSDEVKKQIPEIVDVIYWDYYSTDYQRYDGNIKIYKEMKESMWFAGGLWAWTGFTPHNEYSIKISKAALGACIDNNVKNVFMTVWHDDGCECSRFSVLPSLFYVSCLAKGITDEGIIKAEFEKKFGIPFDEFIELDLLGTPNATPERPCNPEKYMFYSDLFMGQFDAYVEDGVGEKYLECSKRLGKNAENEDFGIQFKSASKLAEVISVKYELGVKTRRAYLSKSRDEVRKVIADYDKLLTLLDEFYSLFKKQWMNENKPHGFDVQDVRIGGLIQRTKHCRETLCDYVDGVIDAIPELDEPVLKPFGETDSSSIIHNSWCSSVTANVL